MRVLVCLDAVPAADGSCAQQAWVEQPSVADLLPTVAQANEIGWLFLGSLAVIAFVKHGFKPPRED
ncbi:hypothetical protein [Aerolutibacter daejeonensis]|uniref:hypothetical protein n=1 Tax=Aerolutibacter daejeonensis TaxID=346181 RepID=UPI0005609F8A|nr:hypothetical protein [Lysobacter daejeonensis]